MLVFASVGVVRADALGGGSLSGQGLGVAIGGVGLEDLGAGTENLDITIPAGVTVESATLYWVGRDRPCQPNGSCAPTDNDQELLFDGNLLTGAITGTEFQADSDDDFLNIGFKADVTAIVQGKGTGAVSFVIEDGDTSKNLWRLNGAGLYVLYTDPSDGNVYQVITTEGLDFVYGDADDIGPNTVSEPVVFSYAAVANARAADLIIFSGDGVEDRGDRIDISDNASIDGQMNSSSGASFDADVFSVEIPANATSTTVELVSEPRGTNPDSLLWQLAALRIPLEPPPPPPPGGGEGCTPGFWKNHQSAWVGYATTDDPATVFAIEDVFSGADTLLEALQQGGGKDKALGRHAVAALLNASTGEVDYDLTTAQIIALVQDAYATGDFNGAKNQLEGFNEQGCPTNGR